MELPILNERRINLIKEKLECISRRVANCLILLFGYVLLTIVITTAIGSLFFEIKFSSIYSFLLLYFIVIIFTIVTSIYHDWLLATYRISDSKKEDVRKVLWVVILLYPFVVLLVTPPWLGGPQEIQEFIRDVVAFLSICFFAFFFWVISPLGPCWTPRRF